MPRLTPEREEEILELRRNIRAPWKPCPDKAFVFTAGGDMVAEIRGLGAGMPMDAHHDFIVAAPTIVDELYAEVLALRESIARSMRFELATPVVVDVKALEESIARWRRDPLHVIVAAPPEHSAPTDEEAQALIRIDSNNYSESDMGVLHSYVRRLELTKKDLQP